ncbi:hypothetical protein GCT13_25080 [Paraburkholderia sp. CNPSo 3157]|uniref:Uncharacterized protein n=1 Tax=Paraburkholderia franconis TaxID=2654983 RepID=A0A7X1NEI8_9BURK|nr:hypothetical protein [Paraburkholderia franconis]MPW20076.1 hypothetical protein [Paraburkholderia franconis]
MQSHIHFPENFPLHGIERDAFETKLRNALYDLFDGNRVRRLVDQVDARRSFDSAGVLPLCRIGDEYTFAQYMALDRCTFGDMSAALRRFILRAVGARPGFDLIKPHFAADLVSEEGDATNRLSPSSLSNKIQRPRAAEPTKPGLAVMLAATAGGAAGWWVARPVAAPMVAVSTSPAQTLRKLAGSVPHDRRAYRISVQVEPQATAPVPY